MQTAPREHRTPNPRRHAAFTGLSLVASALLVAPSASAAPTCITLTKSTAAVEDVMILSSQPASNFDTSTSLFTGVSKGSYPGYSLMRFDLSAIPGGSVLTSAVVTLEEQSAGGAFGTVNAHQILGGWSPTTVTWSNFNAGYAVAAAAHATSAPAPATLSFDLTALAQKWVDGTVANEGVLLEQGLGGAYGVTYYNSVAGPSLAVCYLDLCAGVTCQAEDSCHGAGTCDPTTGACSNPAKADGSACAGGTCSGGVCAQSCASAPGACSAPACQVASPQCSWTGNVWQVLSGSSIQAVIDGSAGDGDTIVVGPGTYHETLSFNGKRLQLVSSTGSASTVLDGGGAGSVVTLDGSACAVVQGFTIQNGSSIYGPGVEATGAGYVVVDSDRIVGNQSPDVVYGGGVYVSGGAFASVTNSVVSNNTSVNGAYGGGVYVEYTGGVEIANNLITGNTTGAYFYGGGFSGWSNGPTDISGNTVCSNTAISYMYGGGLYVDSYGAVTIADNTVQRNTAGSYGYGGGIELNDASTASIHGNFVLDNTAGDYGYGMGIELWNGTISVVGNVVARNLAEDYLYGGGIISWTNGTIAGNTVDSNDLVLSSAYSDPYIYGGGIELFSGGGCTVSNNVVTNNGLASVAFLYGGGIDDEFGTSSLSGNDVWNNGQPQYDGPAGAGDFAADPLYVSSTDLHLQAGSPASGIGALPYGAPCDDGGFGSSGICVSVCACAAGQ